MRRTPGKDTIIRLQAEGLTQREIAKQFGVSDAAISWAIHHRPKVKKYVSFVIPSRVIDHWRNEWRWSEEKIKEASERYAKSRTM